MSFVNQSVESSLDQTLDQTLSQIVLQPFKPDIVNDTAVLDAVFESDLLSEDEYSHIGPYLYRYWDFGITPVPKGTHDRLNIFRISMIGSEAYNQVNNWYIPTTRDTGHTANTLKPLHVVQISVVANALDCELKDTYSQDPFLKALLVLNLPINTDILLLDETLEHLKDLVSISGLEIQFEIKTTVNLKHKKLLSSEIQLENSLSMLSVFNQGVLAQDLSKYFPLIHLPTSNEDAIQQIDSNNFKMSSLQTFCIYQKLKLSISHALHDVGIYSGNSFYIETDRTKFQLKETGSFNFKIGVLDDDHSALESAFWLVLNKGFIFDVSSFKAYVDLKDDDLNKTDVYTETKNDNIHFKSTYYELLIRILIDEKLKSDRRAIEIAIRDKDWSSVLNVIRDLSIFKKEDPTVSNQ